MIEEIKKLISQTKEELKKGEDAAKLRIKYLGRKGRLADLSSLIKNLPVAERPIVGQVLNSVKLELDKLLTPKTELSPKQAVIDPTLPAMSLAVGHLHLITQAISKIENIFARLGFVRRSYPEVEWDWYAFESLNMPSGHPARDEWETFFVDEKKGQKGEVVLTPHTSSGQVREMEKGSLPIRMINIAKCYRRQIDVSHTPMFHQFEGLVVDKGINIGHLKYVLEYFAHSYFGVKRQIRLRPFHFKFTEPSFEIDVTCGVCGAKGCRLCKAGWLELGGAGMVHPNVLRAGKIDPEYTGLAFGWGVERVLSMSSGLKLPDIRSLYENDIKFLEQF